MEYLTLTFLHVFFTPQTTQIMIGVVMFLSGIVMVFAQPPLAVYSGIFVWGAIVVS